MSKQIPVMRVLVLLYLKDDIISMLKPTIKTSSDKK